MFLGDWEERVSRWVAYVSWICKLMIFASNKICDTEAKPSLEKEWNNTGWDMREIVSCGRGHSHQDLIQNV